MNRQIPMSTDGLSDNERAQLQSDMQEFSYSPEMNKAFVTVGLAEKILCSMVEEWRPAPSIVVTEALKYAGEMVDRGELYLKEAFDKWRASRQVEELAPEDVSDLDPDVTTSATQQAVDGVDAAIALGLDGATIDPSNAVTRDDAVADTQRRGGPTNLDDTVSRAPG